MPLLGQGRSIWLEPNSFGAFKELFCLERHKKEREKMFLYIPERLNCALLEEACERMETGAFLSLLCPDHLSQNREETHATRIGWRAAPLGATCRAGSLTERIYGRPALFSHTNYESSGFWEPRSNLIGRKPRTGLAHQRSQVARSLCAMAVRRRIVREQQ